MPNTIAEMSSSSDSDTGSTEAYNGTDSQPKYSEITNNLGEPEEVREREKLDDAAFEAQTRMPGASEPGTKEEDKSIVQKVVDKVAGVNDEASREYLAS